MSVQVRFDCQMRSGGSGQLLPPTVTQFVFRFLDFSTEGKTVRKDSDCKL